VNKSWTWIGLDWVSKNGPMSNSGLNKVIVYEQCKDEEREWNEIRCEFF